jgi:hypothetical protein
MADGVTRATGTVNQGTVNAAGNNSSPLGTLARDYGNLPPSDRATALAAAPARERFRLATDSQETDKTRKEVESIAKATGRDEFEVVRDMRNKPGANQQVLANLDRYFYARDKMRDAVKSGNPVDVAVAAGIGLVGGTVDAGLKVLNPGRGRSDASLGGITNTAAGALAGITGK